MKVTRYEIGGPIPGDPPMAGANVMYNNLSPSLQDYAARMANKEAYYGSNKNSFYEDVMRRNQQFGALRDRDNNVLPEMGGQQMREALDNRGDMGFPQAKMAMMLDRMLKRAMAGDTYAEDFLQRINNAYDDRLAGGQREAARQARLAKGSGKPGPFEQ